MKYIVVLGDGMADRPLASLGGRTPLETAVKPNMDFLAKNGAAGMAHMIPKGMPLGSDVANMSVMGYAPSKYYSGRSPLEAVSMGVKLLPDDVAMRCNLVSVSDEAEYADKTMIDYSSEEITTEEAAELIRYLSERLDESDMRLHAGISYRHCLVLNNARLGTKLTPPHDITGKPVKDFLPAGENGTRLYEYMKRSYELLKDHPVNKSRVERGLLPANSCWFWGEGTKPAFDSFKELYGLNGGVVCAVDLIKGLGLSAGMRVPFVKGATGAKRTDFDAKGKAALALLRDGCDFVYVHIEAPDESGHAGDTQCKIEAIEAIDKLVLGQLMQGLNEDGEQYVILLAPDHPTPIEIRTHSGDAVPFVLYDSERKTAPNAEAYTEKSCAATGLFINEGHTIMKKLINRDF